MEITCPSGLVGTLRGLTVGEASVLADRQKMREGLVVSDILKRSWSDTTDAGPYNLPDGTTIDWEEALVADRFYATMMTRVATYGADYEFKVACAACREPITWGLSLTDLPMKKLSEETLETFKQGNRFNLPLPDHKVAVIFKLMLGKDERKAQKALRASKNRLVTALAQRIVEIKGEATTKGEKLSGQINKMRWINNLGMSTAMEILNKFDEVDGGVETDIEIICPECGMVQTVALPFDRPEFWVPLKRPIGL